jgi:hypothetical protein
VIPETDQYLAISSTLNVTFTCNVSEDGSVGIFLETRSPGVANLIVTGVAGEQYSESGVMVRCLAETAAVAPTV